MDEYLDFFDEIAEAIEQVFIKFRNRGDKITKDDLLQAIEFLDNHDFFEQFSESKKVMNKALFEDIYKSGGGRLQEVKASLAANVLTKYMNNYIKGGQIPADASDLAKQFSMNLGQAARTGSEGIDNDLGSFFSKYDTINAICAAVTIRCSNPQAALNFFSRYGKMLGKNIDLNTIKFAVELAKKDQSLSLTAAQQQVRKAA